MTVVYHLPHLPVYEGIDFALLVFFAKTWIQSKTFKTPNPPASLFWLETKLFRWLQLKASHHNTVFTFSGFVINLSSRNNKYILKEEPTTKRVRSTITIFIDFMKCRSETSTSAFNIWEIFQLRMRERHLPEKITFYCEENDFIPFLFKSSRRGLWPVLLPPPQTLLAFVKRRGRRFLLF